MEIDRNTPVKNHSKMHEEDRKPDTTVQTVFRRAHGLHGQFCTLRSTFTVSQRKKYSAMESDVRSAFVPG